MPKVTLIIERDRAGRWRNPDCGITDIKSAFGYYLSRAGRYVHRVRSGRIHAWKGGYSHTSFSLWCGMSGRSAIPGKAGGGKLREFPPDGFPICATCEGRAIGAGQTDSATINGRAVMFSPRTGRK